MTPLLILNTLGVYAILAAVIWLGTLVRRRGRHFVKPEAPAPQHGPHMSPLHPPAHHVVWEWRDARWRRVDDNLPAGVNSGPPPGYPGAIDGEVVKTWVRPHNP